MDKDLWNFAIRSAQEEADELQRRVHFDFTAAEVAALYTQEHGYDGFWFELQDGRILDSLNQPARYKKSAYGGKIKGAEAREIAAYILTHYPFEPESYE